MFVLARALRVLARRFLILDLNDTRTQQKRRFLTCRAVVRGALSVSALAFVLTGSASARQSIERLNVGLGGAEPNGAVQAADISATGRYIAFSSSASNLVVNDTNNAPDVFVFDRVTGTTTRVSVSSTGQQAPTGASSPSISADGTLIAFTTASSLQASDTDTSTDVYVHFTTDSTTWRYSAGGGISPTIANGGSAVAFQSRRDQYGFCGNGWWTPPLAYDIYGPGGQVTCADPFGESKAPALAANGTFAFVSRGYEAYHGFWGNSDSVIVGSPSTSFTRVHSDDSNCFRPDISADGSRVVYSAPSLGGLSVWLYEALSARRIAEAPGGLNPNGPSDYAKISADGNWVVYASQATNLAPGDSNGTWDVYLHDLQASTNSLISLSGCASANGASQFPAISGDGRYTVFVSAATNLVSGDSNGVSDLFLSDRLGRCYLDADNDGFGSPCNYLLGPNCSAGYVTNGLDCDDSNPAIHPSRTETCNGIDDNCNGVVDESLIHVYYEDADGDGYGNASTAVGLCSMPSGWVTNGLDCDDTYSRTYPGAAEICDGRDNDCDGTIDPVFTSSYCTAGTSIYGCVPSISGVGAPSSTASSGFTLQIHNVPAERYGLFFYGSAPTAQIWSPGSSSYFCVFFPISRTGVLDSGGTPGTCEGVFSLDWNAWRSANPTAHGSPFAAGEVFYAQGWYRDPGAAQQTNLSNGLRFTLCD